MRTSRLFLHNFASVPYPYLRQIARSILYHYLRLYVLVKQSNAERSAPDTDRMRTLAEELRTQQLPELRKPTLDPELQRILQRHAQQ